MNLFAAFLIVASLILMGMTAFGYKNPKQIHYGWLGMIVWILALLVIGAKNKFGPVLDHLFT